MEVKEDESGLFIELNDSEVAMFAEIGVNHALREGLDVIRPRKGSRFGTQDDEWDEERMDVVGQNGNDGLHYPPHADYIMDNPTEEEKEANLRRYHERLNAMNERHERLKDNDVYI